MNKKPDKKLYEAPAVKKVKLEIKNATLSVCFSSSTNTTPKGLLDSCKIADGGCYN